jgi:hypothetical protein
MLGGATAARADEALAWRGDDGCGSVASLRARIAVHLGRDLSSDDGVRATVEVTRAPLERDVRAHLIVVTAGGTRARDVRGADCAAVVDAVAFVLASAVTDERDPDDAPTGPPGLPSPPEQPPRRPTTGTPRPAVVKAHVRLDGWSDAGTMPEFRFGAGGTLGVSYARARVEVGVTTWRQGWTRDEDGGTPASMRELDVRGCGAVWEVWVCGGALAGTYRHAQEASQRWSAVSGLVRWTRPLGQRVALSASIESLASIDRPRYEARQASPVSVRLGVGVELIAF